MGLDIIAISKIDFSSLLRDEEKQHDQEVFLYVYPNNHFEIQNEGLKSGAYNLLPGSEEFHFRAGSYGGYGFWRRQLAKMIGTTAEEIWNNPEKFKDQPFYELINFSDCESFIGPKTSAKLYQDFVKYDEIASNFSKMQDEDIPGWGFKDRYNDWKKAFEIASDGGCVCFH